MVDVALNVGAVLLVLLAFGLPLAIAVGPAAWRGWWPVSAPLYGLSGLAVLQLPLGTVFSPGAIAVPALVLALLSLAFSWRRYGGLPVPAVASLAVVAAVVPAGLLAYRPTLRLQEPRPSGVLNEDSIYYLGIDAWLKDHGIRDEPPTPDVDGFYATAHAAWADHLRIGVDLVNVQTSTLLGVDALDTLPALAASLVAFVGLGTALAVRTLRAPAWASVLAALFVTTRPETLRLSLDSYVAQASGVALAPVAASALVLAIVLGGWRWAVTAGLFAGALAAYYVEYAPWLVLTGALVVCVILMFPRFAESVPSRPSEARIAVVRRALAVAAWGVVLNPLAVYNGVKSLSAGSSLNGEVILPFYSLLRSLGLVTGPFSVLYPAQEATLFLSAAAGVAVLSALPHLPRVAVVSLGAMLAAAGVFVLQQAYIQEYSYGLYKVLGLAAPLAAIGLAVIVAAARTPIGIRSVASVTIIALLIVNVPASLDVSRGSVGSVNGMVPEDDDLVRIPELLRGVNGLALEGTDAAGTPNARQHYGLYFLRSYNRQQVTYARGPGSYFTTGLDRGPADVDLTYSPDYGGVVSWGPSLTHGDQVGQLGGWHVYRRPAGPDMLLVGRDGWLFPTVGPGGRVMRWTRGPAAAWVNAERPAKVRVRLEVTAPFRAERLRVRVGDREVLSRVIPTSPRTVLTEDFNVPRGRTIVSFLSTPRLGPSGGDALGVGVTSARVVVDGT